MPSLIDSGFGANLDNLLGAAGNVNQKQTGFGEFRARSILAGASGAMISSIHITPRNGLTATMSDYPAAGMYSLIGFFSRAALDVAQNNFQFAAIDFQSAQSVFLNSSRSTLLTTDIVPPGGIYVPANLYAHVLCLTPRTAAGAGLATFFDLTVLGRQLQDGDALPYTLR